jgi:hypothetical protein
MARGLSFNAVFPALFQQAGSFAAGLVQYDRVRVVVRHSDATTAIDTIYAFGAGSDSVVVSLNVPLLASAPDSGEALRLSLYYLSSAGDTMFKGGPATVIARGDAAGRNSKPVTVPVSYSGPGANAALVVISPRSLAVPAGDNFALTANARDSTGHTIPRTPIFWTSLDPARVTIASPTTGGGIATGQRGTARVVAQLVNGLADTVTIQIEPQPSAISTQSGDGQGGVVNAMLAQPLVARVVGGDGLGVEGALVSFFLRAGGGTLGATTVATDANGLAQTSWRLGALVGAQSAGASVAGVSISATFGAIAGAAAPARLVVTAEPASAVVGAVIAPVIFTAQDAAGNAATAFTGPVTIALGDNTANAALSGTTTVNAVAGVATFTTLALNRVGAGYTLVGSTAGVTSAITGAFDVLGTTAGRLVFTAQPSNAVAGADIGKVVVTAEDGQGNPDPSFTGTVQLALAANLDKGALAGTVSAAAVAGVATFAGLSVNRPATGYALSASAKGVISARSSPFDVLNGAASRFSVENGDGQAGSANAPLAQPVVVRVSDQSGNGVAGVTVTFAVATGGGTVSPASSTTDALGLAQATWTLGRTPGRQTVNATAGNLTTSGITFSATALASAATALSVSALPASTVAGGLLGPSITVTALDGNGNVATSFTDAVTLSLDATATGALLAGTATVSAVAGVATFSDLSVVKAAASYTLTAHAGTLAPATSNSFAIAAAAPAALALSGGDGQSGPVSKVLGAPLAVLVADSYGNPVSGVSVSWTAKDGSVSAGASQTNGSGVATVTWTLGAALGPQTASATLSGVAGPVAFSATGLAPTASRLEMTAVPGTTIAGVTLGPSIVVTAKDAGNNVAGSFTGAVTLALSTNPTAAALAGTTTVSAVGGVATFNDLSLTKAGAGYRLSATASSLASATSNAFSIAPAAATTLAVSAGNAQTGVVAQTLNSALAVSVTDQFGNPVPNATVAWATANGSVSGSTSVTNAVGIANINWRLGTVAGAQTATASSGTLAGSPLQFSAAALAGGATKLAFGALPATTVAGVRLASFSVTARDAWGNIATSYGGHVSLRLGSSPGGASMSGTTDLDPVAGVATFPDIVFTTASAGGYTLVIDGSDGVSSATSSAFSITAAAPAIITKVGGDNQSILLNILGILLPNPLSVAVTDAFGNPISGVTVNWSVTLGSAQLGSGTSTTNGAGVATNTLRMLGLFGGTRHVTATVAGAGSVIFTESGL